MALTSRRYSMFLLQPRWHQQLSIPLPSATPSASPCTGRTAALHHLQSAVPSVRSISTTSSWAQLPPPGERRNPPGGLAGDQQDEEQDHEPDEDAFAGEEEEEAGEQEEEEPEGFEDILETLRGEPVEGDDVGVNPLEDDSSDDEESPRVTALRRASKKQQQFLLEQYWREMKDTRDQDELDLQVIRANDEAGWRRFAMRLVDINRITKVTKQGRLIRYSSMVAVGNGLGGVGIGKAKSLQLNTAIRKAHVRALRYPMVIQRYRRATVYAPVEWKYGKTRVRIWPKSVGNGIRANQLLGDLARMIGFTDLGVKVIGSTNNRNQVKAFLYGLMSIKDPVDVAMEQGKVLLERAVGKYHIPLDRLLVELGHRHPNWPNVTPEENKPFEPNPFRQPVRPYWYE